MRTVDLNEQEIFLNALDISSAIERKDYIYGACGQNSNLRKRIEDLLKHHHQGSFILDKQVALNAEGTITARSPEANDLSGTTVGRYHLVKKIGSGGMGDVYLAEQKEPIRRRVAVKIIKLGLDTKNFVVRFAAERQALALMDHEGITKVFDAGATETGRPFFVMELVSGEPITKYCDENRFELKQRLELFVELCKAIQHAHQKGVIHRDLKPSNILAGKKDQDTSLKVIDFGVSKATTERIPGQTDLTKMACMIGTPEYMSPEQTDTQGNDQDIRTDIYSLGAILFELLTGSTPFELENLSSKKIFTVREIIQTRSIDRPSARVTRLVDTKPQVFRDRQSDPSKLAKLLKGNLDAICLKCLSKDRSQRYHTVAGLINDLQLHLGGLPVSCVRSNLLTRALTFSRRNKKTILATALGSVAMFTMVAFSIFSIIRIRRLENERNTAVATSNSNFAEARQAKRMAALQKAKVERLEQQVASEQRQLFLQRAELLAVARFNKTQTDLLSKLLKSKGQAPLSVSPDLRGMLSSESYDAIIVHPEGNRSQGDLEFLKLLLVEQKKLFGNSDVSIAETLDRIGQKHLSLKQFEQATAALRESLFIRTDTGGDLEKRVLTMIFLSRALAKTGREVDSTSYFSQAMRLADQLPESSRVHEILTSRAGVGSEEEDLDRPPN